MLMNVVVLALLFPWRIRLPRLKAGYFFIAYLFLYGLSQFIVFFARGTEPTTPFLGITGLKQAQWTGLAVMLLCIPLFLYIRRVSSGWPYSDANPQPWPPAPAAASVSARVAPSMPSRLATKSQLRPLTRPAKSPSGTGSVTSEPAIELPPWHPVRPIGGALRNVFGPPSQL
jgi:hypothetical protein